MIWWEETKVCVSQWQGTTQILAPLQIFFFWSFWLWGSGLICSQSPVLLLHEIYPLSLWDSFPFKKCLPFSGHHPFTNTAIEICCKLLRKQNDKQKQKKTANFNHILAEIVPYLLRVVPQPGQPFNQSFFPTCYSPGPVQSLVFALQICLSLLSSLSHQMRPAGLQGWNNCSAWGLFLLLGPSCPVQHLSVSYQASPSDR